MLLQPFDHLLGTRTKVRLLRTLAPLDRPVSGREAARLAGVSRIAIRTLDELGETGILNQVAATGQNLYTFNRMHHLAGVLEKLFESERNFALEVFARLRDALQATGPIESAVVFGSAARGEAGPGSDLDVLVVVCGARIRKGVQVALAELAPQFTSEFGLRLSPVILTLVHVREQSREGDPFMSEVLRDARQVLGRPLEELIDG